MIDVINLAYTIIDKYEKKMGKKPTAFILQKIMYFCQLEYMQENNNETLFSNEILCSTSGPCILEISEWFDDYNVIPIQIYEGDLEEKKIKDNPEVTELIDRVLRKLLPYLDSAVKLRDLIINNSNSAWNLQKRKDNFVRTKH